MQVRAKVVLQYGIVRAEGEEFALSDDKHFDAVVMERVGAAPVKAAAKVAAKPDAATVASVEPKTATTAADAGPTPEQIAQELGAVHAANADEAAQGATPAPRRRSTASQRG